MSYYVECSMCEGGGEVCITCHHIEEFCNCVEGYDPDDCPRCEGMGDLPL